MNSKSLIPQLDKGTLFGGLPGPTPYFFSSKTYLECGGDRRKLWSLLQQKTGQRKDTYTPAVRQYTFRQEKIDVLTSYANSNPEYGTGGGEVIYVKNYKNVLVPVLEHQDLNKIEPPVDGLKLIMNFELSLGNEIDYIDHDTNGKLYGVYLKKPFHVPELNAQKFQISGHIKPFDSAENKFCIPEQGFICHETRQFLTAPQMKEVGDWFFPIEKEIILSD